MLHHIPPFKRAYFSRLSYLMDMAFPLLRRDAGRLYIPAVLAQPDSQPDHGSRKDNTE